MLCCALYLPGLMTLPVTDRDEARFAQATKQMLETGNYVDIRFQAEPRYKKPIGIYWLQAVTARLGVAAGAALNDIGIYRIPSFLSALGVVLLTFWTARPIFGRMQALRAAALLAPCLMLTFEAHIAKSDAALLAFIMLAQGALFRIVMTRPPAKLSSSLAALFWLGLGLAILIKGPIGPTLTLLTAAAFLTRSGDRSWLHRLQWHWGLPLLLAITLPWFIAIGISSHGEFFRSSLGQDFGGKLQGGQESHGAPPGVYLALLLWTFWPSVLFVTGSAFHAVWRLRRSKRMLFLFAWIAPYWLLIEAIPTKLPHYALPVYPALAMAAVYAAGFPSSTFRWRISLVPWLGVAFAHAVLLTGLGWIAEMPNLAFIIAAAAALVALAVMTGSAAWRGLPNATLVGLIACGILFHAVAFGFVLPRAQPLWLSETAEAAVKKLRACGAQTAGFAGLASPSLVFLNGTHTLLTQTAPLANALADTSTDAAFVNWRDDRAFEAAFIDRTGLLPALAGCVDGIDLNGKGPTRLQVYVRPSSSHLHRCLQEAVLCSARNTVRWRQLLNTKF